MKNINIKCPAKINLTLEIVNKRNDGFHNIKSVMQTVSLYDYLSISLKESASGIRLAGNSSEIPYNEKNLVYKAVDLFLTTANIQDVGIDIFIEKNIPVAAGLAGGSTDAAGTLYGLNKLFNGIFDDSQLNDLCAKLGSDLNVCLRGGCVLATSRGEVTEPLTSVESKVTLIKPKSLGISASEAYKKYASKEVKPKNNMTEKLIEAMRLGNDIRKYLYNDLEYAVFDDYQQLQKIKSIYPQAIMSGSGSTYFVLEELGESKLDSSYEFINGLEFIKHGVIDYDS